MSQNSKYSNFWIFSYFYTYTKNKIIFETILENIFLNPCFSYYSDIILAEQFIIGNNSSDHICIYIFLCCPSLTFGFCFQTDILYYSLHTRDFFSEGNARPLNSSLKSKLNIEVESVRSFYTCKSSQRNNQDKLPKALWGKLTSNYSTYLKEKKRG